MEYISCEILMWKVCLCTRNKGQSVVHQWADSAAGSTDQALLTPAMAHTVYVRGGGVGGGRGGRRTAGGEEREGHL